MEEKVIITLLEANREVPSRDQIIERFKSEFKANLEHSLANPQEVVVSASVLSMADPNQDSLEALQIREEVTVDPAIESESARAESRWTYAEEESGQFVAPEAAPEAEHYQPADPTPIPEEELFVAPQPQVDDHVMAGLEAVDDGMTASVAQGDRAQVPSEEMSSSIETVTSVSSLDEPSASMEAFQEEATQSVDDEPMTSQPSAEGGKKKKKKKK